MDVITNYLQTVTGDAASNITDMLFQWLVIPSIIFMVIIVALYTWRTVNRHRVDKAIFEIRDTLREMNLTSPAPLPEPKPNQTETKEN